MRPVSVDGVSEGKYHQSLYPNTKEKGPVGRQFSERTLLKVIIFNHSFPVSIQWQLNLRVLEKILTIRIWYHWISLWGMLFSLFLKIYQILHTTNLSIIQSNSKYSEPAEKTKKSLLFNHMFFIFTKNCG